MAETILQQRKVLPLPLCGGPLLPLGFWMTCEKRAQVKDKFYITIDEAADDFNIGKKKLRNIVADHI